MKFTVITRDNKKVELIHPIVLFMFLLNGCVTPLGQTVYFRECQKAEKAVIKAEQVFDEASQKLANGNKDATTIKNFSIKMQELEEAHENAFERCNRN